MPRGKSEHESKCTLNMSSPSVRVINYSHVQQPLRLKRCLLLRCHVRALALRFLLCVSLSQLADDTPHLVVGGCGCEREGTRRG
jgi:hypothetical protein